MESKSIIANLKPNEIDKAKAVLKVLRLTISDLNLDNINFRDIDDKIALSFSFNSKHSKTVAERFALNGIEIIAPDEESKEVIDFAKKKLERRDSKGFDGWENSTSGKNESKAEKPIHELVKEGEFETLIDLTRDVRVSKEKKSEAEKSIDVAIANSLKIIYTFGIENPYKADDQVTKLINISSSSKLRFLNKKKFMHEAGLLAVKLAGTFNETMYKLVDIYNNSYIEKPIAIEAISTFVARVITSEQSNTRAINYAVKKTNMPILQNLFNASRKNLTSSQELVFKKLVDFISSKRKA